MKVTKLIQGVVVAVAVLCSVPVPKASAQVLSNKWFKLKFSGKGFIINPVTKDSVKGAFSLPVFAQFISTTTNATSVGYTIHLWTDTDAGWSNATTQSRTTISTNNDTFISDSSISLLGLGGNSVFGFHSPHLIAKTKSGAFQSATYQGIGEITGGTIIEGLVTNNFIGSFSLIGTTVATNKLPFVAP